MKAFKFMCEVDESHQQIDHDSDQNNYWLMVGSTKTLKFTSTSI